MIEPDDELERLRASEQRLRAAIEAGGIGVWEYDPQSGASFSPARRS
jgi:PAS domain-containing protein